VIANKVRRSQDEAFLEEKMTGFEILGYIPYADEIVEADMDTEAPYRRHPELLRVVDELVGRLLDSTAA
jgi:CO dehydrogenase maturation factor